MKSRTFFLSLLTSASLLITAGMTGRVMAAAAAQPQYFELRVHTTKSEAQQQLISDYWQKAAVPAYNRLGVATVGVFTELETSPSNHVYVLIPFASLSAYAAVPAQLAADAGSRVDTGYLRPNHRGPANAESHLHGVR